MEKKYEDKYQNTINNIDWTELLKVMRNYDYGMGIWIYEDGTIDIQTSGTYPGKNSAVVATFKAWGSNGSDGCYYDGWGEYDSENDIFTTDDGRKLTGEEARNEAIEDGVWDDQIESWKEEIRYELEMEEEADEYYQLNREAQADYMKS